MSSTRFTKAQVTRAISGAQDAGFEVGVVEVTKDGTIRILPPQAGQQTKPDEVEDFFDAKG
ncbi:hypothetical protein [Candidatus Halocynthiibacter alkanivorans]|jgi:Tfp pilus assembly PilM family ATPase|uniref:hypothetical protein n=1 Tax=Candidatus Halocynthiibacter alkanivorans TaxID=2267619 RepID=UPI00135A2669|nr:hypothetical protein [Candidatus Halocynthiibacter alkanivorans]